MGDGVVGGWEDKAGRMRFWWGRGALIGGDERWFSKRRKGLVGREKV